MKILNGHTSPETAYVVDDYPYGFRLRCKIRYWIEFRSGQGYRFMSQTTNPKILGEHWNKPKASIYCKGACVMYLDSNDHVHWDAVSLWSSAESIAKFSDSYRNDLDADMLGSLYALIVHSREMNPVSWQRFEASLHS